MLVTPPSSSDCFLVTHDKDNLPESIRFWKHRIEERGRITLHGGADLWAKRMRQIVAGEGRSVPSVGHRELFAFYTEATPEETESRLLNGLREAMSLVNRTNLICLKALNALRRESGIPSNRPKLADPRRPIRAMAPCQAD